MSKIKNTLAREKSIAKYGDLTKLYGIKVDYNGTNYTFKVSEKEKITGFETFKTELRNQGIATTKIKHLNWSKRKITVEGLVGELKIKEASAKADKNEKIKQHKTQQHYQELKKQIFNKDSEINAITFENMKTKLEQETTSGTRDFGTTGTLDTTNAKAKKTTAIISEPDQSDLGSESNNFSIILPIVSGVILAIIVIGVLLKKYFKNKKNK